MAAQHDTQSLALEQKLWDAASKGDSATVRMLAMQGVDIDARNPDGFTAFSLATARGHYNTALTILAARNMKYFGATALTPGIEEAREINPLRKANQKQGQSG